MGHARSKGKSLGGAELKASRVVLGPMTNPDDSLSKLDVEQAIDLRWTLRDIRAKRWKLSPIDETHLRTLNRNGPCRNEG